MSMEDVNPLALPADWPWQLGQRILDAARSCGFSCERAFQVDSQQAPLCCDPCQLTVSVVPEITPARGGCGYSTIAHITLMVDTCRHPPVPLETYEWQKTNAQAQVLAMAQAQILMGLEKFLAGGTDDFDFQASLTDPLALSSRNVVGGKWAYLGEDANCVRWTLNLTAALQ